MDSNYPTTKIKEEVKNNDEAEDTPGIKVEQKDPDYEADHESIRFEEVKMKVEGESSISTMEYMGIEDKKEACDIAPLTDEKEIKVETDEADYVTYDMLKKIKDEPNTDQWDELNPAMDAAEHVKKEEPAAVAVKVEGVDSTKTEEMDTTELTEEVDIKPDDDGGVDSAMNEKYWEKGLGVGHREAEGELFICYNCNYTARTENSLNRHISGDNCNLKSNRYVCTKCNREYRRKTHLNDHVIKMHSELIASVTCKIYECTICDYKTVSKDHFDRHTLAHSSRKIHNCPYCNYKTTKIRKLDSHIMSKHRGEDSSYKLPTCIHCNATFKKRQILDDHIIRKHPNFISSVTRIIYQCPSCEYKTVFRSDLEKHLPVHPGGDSNNELSKCTHCNMAFTSKQSMNNHIIKYHPNFTASVKQKIYQCPNCTYKTVFKSSFDRHQLTHRRDDSNCEPSACTHCNIIFTSKRSLNNHVIKKHPNFTAPVTQKVHQCPECTYKTVLKCDFDKHLLVHSGADTNFEKCTHCNMEVTSKQSLNNHIIKYHPNFTASVTQKIYQCLNCTYKTVFKSSFDRHLLTHPRADSNSEPSTCAHCNITFTSKRSLNNHIIRKHPNFIASVTQKIHQCPDCAYKTVSKSDFDKHVLVHSGGDSNYEKCTHCNMTFKSKRSFNNHIIRKHPNFTA